MIYLDRDKGLEYCFSTKGRNGVLAFLLACLTLGVVGVIFVIFNLKGLTAGNSSLGLPVIMLACVVPPALAGASLRYIRKLYLLAFMAGEGKGLSDSGALRFASYLYFYSRPILVTVATYFLMLALFAGLLSIFIGLGTLTEEGWWAVLAVSFFVGAAGGYPIDRVLDIGSTLTKGLFDVQGKGD